MESFGGTCKDELYDVENFAHRQAFFDKGATHQLFYNADGKNRWK